MSNKVTQQSVANMFRTLNRRRIPALIAAAFIFVAIIILLITRPRTYDSTATIQFQKEGAGALNLSSLTGAASGGESDPLGANVDIQTQAQILQSDALALKVIEGLNLESTKDFNVKPSILDRLRGLLATSAVPDASGAPLERAPQRREHVLSVFKSHLHVSVIAGTHLIQVGYTSTDPTLAAEVSNALVRSLIEYSFQTKFEATNEVSKWLEQQLGDFRKENEDLQAKVVALQKSTGLYGLAGADSQGRSLIFSPVLERLQQSTIALAQAEQNEFLKNSIYKAVSSGNAELISQLGGSATSLNAGAGVSNSLNLIQSLRAQEATLQAQIAQDSAKFGSAYPRLIEEHAALQRVQQSLKDETGRVAARAKNDDEIAQRDLESARQTYATDKEEANQLNDRTIEYSIVRREAEQSETLYQTLLQRLREAGILEGLKSYSITIVDEARAPAHPSHPSKPLFVFAGLVFGLLGGLGCALFLESVDDAVRTPEEVTEAELPLLGILPTRPEVTHVIEPGDGTIDLIHYPKSQYSEAVRRLRSSLMIARRGAPPRSCLLTSGSAQEGKSTTSIELAASFAQLGKKALVIEADLRRPVLQKRLGLDFDGGLSLYLAGQNDSLDFPTVPGLPNLSVLPAGPPPPFPAELLTSDRMEGLVKMCVEKFDMVIIDCPPVLAVTDAEVLVHLVDLTLLLVRPGRTRRISMMRSADLLEQHLSALPDRSFGIVVNGLDLKETGYYGYYGYYGTGASAYVEEGPQS